VKRKPGDDPSRRGELKEIATFREATVPVCPANTLVVANIPAATTQGGTALLARSNAPSILKYVRATLLRWTRDALLHSRNEPHSARLASPLQLTSLAGSEPAWLGRVADVQAAHEPIEFSCRSTFAKYRLPPLSATMAIALAEEFLLMPAHLMEI
jgi:hypothetical protein